MAKSKRGKVAKSEQGWRGSCPICKKPRVKLLWTQKNEAGETIKVCKACR